MESNFVWHIYKIRNNEFCNLYIYFFPAVTFGTKLFFRGFFHPVSSLTIVQNLAVFSQLNLTTEHNKYCQINNYLRFVYEADKYSKIVSEGIWKFFCFYRNKVKFINLTISYSVELRYNLLSVIDKNEKYYKIFF